MVASWRGMSVRVQKGGFMVDLSLRWYIGPHVVFETLELYQYTESLKSLDSVY